MWASLWRNRELLQLMIRREVLGRYRGTYFGVLWSFIHPLLMLLVYTFVFSTVFKSRWPGGQESTGAFALILFAGLLAFNLFSECIGSAPTLVVQHANYVKKVVFPLEILPVVRAGAALVHAGIALLVWLLVYMLFLGWPHATVFLVPLVFLPLIGVVLGLSWFLSALGVYVRDLGQFVGLLVTALMFLSPVFYPVSALPERFHFWMYLNPLTIVIEMLRATLYWGDVSHVSVWLGMSFFSLLVAWLGFAWFQKTRQGFADVL